MSPHLKKFISYLILALVVYVLIYVVLLSYMRMVSDDISNFCEQLEKGTPVTAIKNKAHTEGFSVTVDAIKDNQSRVLSISSPDTSSATCKAHIINGVLDDKKFILRVF